MDSVYIVKLDGNQIGEATVHIRGLYAHIECRCVFPKDGLYRVKMCGNGTVIDLGICIPEDGQFVAKKRILIKDLPKDEISFCAVQQNAQKILWKSGDNRISVLKLKYARREIWGEISRLVEKN